MYFFYSLLTLWVVHAETLMTQGSLLPNKDYRFWRLRGTREDAWTRTIAFYPEKSKPPSDEFLSSEIELGPEEVCSLWSDLLSVEPG
jgi:hypothetical protein